MRQEDYEAMREKAIHQLKTGQSLTGKGGVFAPILQEFLESALEAEMEAHLDEEERQKKNKRNGKGKKTVKTSQGEVAISTPQDRHSSFAPEIIKKRETILAESLSDKIISLYSIGMSYRDISSHIEEMYDMKLSKSTLGQITDKIIPEIKQWQSRSLESVYPIAYLDAIHFKVKHEGSVQTRAVYNIIGLNKEGKKELLGLYMSESEGAGFWLQVLTDLNNRGVQDILIAGIDNLSGFSQAIESIYPKCKIQLCVIHQIRNSLKYVSSKNKKEFMSDLKLVYKADTKTQAELELDNLEEKWGDKYPIVIKSWRDNWDNLSTYFAYVPEIRRLIYTTNTVEGYHRQIRKITKTKGAFTSETALEKLIYLASQNIVEKWKAPVRNWAQIVQQLAIHFGEDRLKLDL